MKAMWKCQWMWKCVKMNVCSGQTDRTVKPGVGTVSVGLIHCREMNEMKNLNEKSEPNGLVVSQDCWTKIWLSVGQRFTKISVQMFAMKVLNDKLLHPMDEIWPSVGSVERNFTEMKFLTRLNPLKRSTKWKSLFHRFAHNPEKMTKLIHL